MQKVKLVVLDNYEFENRDLKLILATLAFLGSPDSYAKKKKMFFSRNTHLSQEVVHWDLMKAMSHLG